ncbi:MAG: hypothetical protein IJA10_10270 [Lachnospiraceae bacterium]|nr:hypothetical protein [Lachnospiraceae bacterium]
MDAILELFNQDFSSLIIGIFILMSGGIAIYKIVSEFFAIFGKPIGVAKQRKADHELLVKTVQDLAELHNKHEEDTKQSIEHDKAIRNDLEKLTQLFIDKEIDDMRWEILNFSSALSSGRQYNKESFEHVIQIHEKYEKVLEENGMENGRVTASMEVIMEEYKDKLRNGF